ncbi:hypothetical protein QBC46DRAFT_447659 [Diplogelasinospora grovesii]|uniref:Nephrocystin 3-like N-terminal domain-containing protein n=1 Tax=Diplogelasinospora grovesii TaxID=303347 RepID=A0AAN6S6W5_9PEZI|nr:hypothetical protein QBC46DRAFT_447659 [Diplogelasinospora grovesii]
MTVSKRPTLELEAAEVINTITHKPKRNILRRIMPLRSKSAVRLDTGDPHKQSIDSQHSSEAIFWPADLLPKECPLARILTWGYDTNVTRYMSGPVNKDSIFTHGKNLLYALGRDRPTGRRIIFVAHSLGGIVVKEMLHSSSVSHDTIHQDILNSTSAVVFLGTPHRGSQDMAGIGETVRRIAATVLRVDTSSAMLDALGLRSSDLQRGQEAFSRLWSTYDFRVKTFQEGLGLTGVNIGVLKDKVVPESSSLLGDFRENAETLQANHFNMARFSGASDPNYRSVAGEVRSIYSSILEVNGRSGVMAHTQEEAMPVPRYHAQSLACLNSLRFPRMDASMAGIRTPMEQTCLWLFEHPTYVNWFQRMDVQHHQGLICIRGNPGSGKSTVMKAACRHAAMELGPQVCVAGHFFNAKGSELEKTTLGFLRSLLHQLLKSSVAQQDRFFEVHKDKFQPFSESPDGDVVWYRDELESYLRETIKTGGMQRTIIFVDALDECANNYRGLSYYLRELTSLAYTAGVPLDICISYRQFPVISLADCPEIVIPGVEKSSGIFLWVVLVVDMLLKDRDEGRSMRQLEMRLESVPRGLQTLFRELLLSAEEDRAMMTRLFQWAALSIQPLRLREWQHIFAFLRGKSPSSLEEWYQSPEYVGDFDQLEKQIRSCSRGLLEVTSGPSLLSATFDDFNSVGGGAGSLDPHQGETRVVQVIHESVRQFLVSGGGFGILDPRLRWGAVGKGHLAIMDMCLDYLHISELDTLANARGMAFRMKSPSSRPSSRKRRGSFTVSSFSSAGSADYKGMGDELVSEPVLSDDGKGENADRDVLGIDDNHDALGLVFGFDGEKPSIAHTTHLMTANDHSALFLSRTREANEDNTAEEPASRVLNSQVDSPLLPGPPTSNGSRKESSEGRLEVLEDFPALLSYASAMLFAHARGAQKDGADPHRIVVRLNHHRVWERWLCFNEDLPQHMTLERYCVSQNLWSWVQCLLDNSSDRVREYGMRAYNCFAAAVAFGKLKIASFILEHQARSVFGVEPDMRLSPTRAYLLHDIARSGDSAMIDVYRDQANILMGRERLHGTLLEILVRLSDRKGKTPLMIAEEEGNRYVAEVLLQLENDIDGRSLSS